MKIPKVLPDDAFSRFCRNWSPDSSDEPTEANDQVPIGLQLRYSPIRRILFKALGQAPDWPNPQVSPKNPQVSTSTQSNWINQFQVSSNWLTSCSQKTRGQIRWTKIQLKALRHTLESSCKAPSFLHTWPPAASHGIKFARNLRQNTKTNSNLEAVEVMVCDIDAFIRSDNCFQPFVFNVRIKLVECRQQCHVAQLLEDCRCLFISVHCHLKLSPKQSAWLKSGNFHTGEQFATLPSFLLRDLLIFPSVLKCEHNHESSKETAEEDGQNQDPCQSMSNTLAHPTTLKSEVKHLQNQTCCRGMSRHHKPPVHCHWSSSRDGRNQEGSLRPSRWLARCRSWTKAGRWERFFSTGC